MITEIGSRLRITNPSPDMVDWCKKHLEMKKFNAELMAHPEWYEQKSVSGGVAVYYGIMMKTTG